MAIEITVPNLGESVTEATVATWLKKPGEAVEADEPIVELETDKATLEIPAPRAGVLGEILVEEGQDVEVGATLGRIEEGEPEEEAEEEGGGAGEEEARSEEEEARSEEEKAKAKSSETEKPTGKKGRARKAKAEAAAVPEGEERRGKRPEDVRAAERPVAPSREMSAGRGRTPAPPAMEAPVDLDPTGIPRSGPEGRVTIDDLQSFFEEASQEAVERSGPAVRKLIADHGLDPTDIPATGREGRITKEDVLTFLAGARSAEDVTRKGDGGQAAPEPRRRREPAPPEEGEEARRVESAGTRAEERVKMSRIRRTIAARLKEAQNTAAILTTFNDVDMSAVMMLRSRLRDEFEEKHGVRLGFMSFFVKAAVQALKELPEANAQIEDEEIVYRYYYDIGVAVSTEAGLKVPVIRACDRKSFAEIETELADLAERAREGTIKLEEMEGGTFSITNGGVFGSLLSTPLLNYPQSAILGLHRIEERPVVIDGEVGVRPMMYLALSYDHRLIDGRESVGFLKRIKHLIEDPQRLMLEV